MYQKYRQSLIFQTFHEKLVENGKMTKIPFFSKNSEYAETWHKPHKHESKVISITNAMIPSVMHRYLAQTHVRHVFPYNGENCRHRKRISKVRLHDEVNQHAYIITHRYIL